MDDADQLELMRLFLAAIASQLKVTSVTLDWMAFTAAVTHQPDNPFARRFPVLTTVMGPMCPDFLEGMAVARCAGLLSHIVPSQRRFVINLSGRQVRALTDDPRFEDARRLAEEYLATAV